MSDSDGATYSRAALRDLFGYTTFTWNSYGRCIASLPPDAFSQPVPGSGWVGLRQVFFHLALAWDSWLRDRLGVNDPLDVTPDAVLTWEAMEIHREKVRGWLGRVIDETSDDDLHARTLVLGEGPTEMHASVADVVLHVLLHERGHHGDVTTLLAQLGASPPQSDYVVYRFLQQRRESEDADG